MLVVSRKKSESVHIGDSITFTIIDVRGANVRVGIDAPPSEKILRNELQSLEMHSRRMHKVKLALQYARGLIREEIADANSGLAERSKAEVRQVAASLELYTSIIRNADVESRTVAVA